MPYKCPAAPYEAALIIDKMLRSRGVREKTEIEIVTWEPAPMPVAGPIMGQAILSMMEPGGISYKPNSTINSVDPDTGQADDEAREPLCNRRRHGDQAA